MSERAGSESGGLDASSEGESADPDVLHAIIERERARVDELSARLRIRETESRVWRERAEAAEEALASWNVWTTRPGWRLFLRLAAIRARLVPKGSLHERSLLAVYRSLVRRRDGEPPAVLRPPPTPAAKAILYLSGRAGATRRYRCDHQAEQLRLLGANLDVLPVEEADLDAALERYACFVLHRVPLDARVGAFVIAARERGRPVVYDADDLVFDTSAADRVPETVRHDRGIDRQRQTLDLSAAVTVSTESLRRVAALMNPRAAVLPNVVSEELVSRSDAALERRVSGPRDGGVAIAYFSGTATHDLDFLEAAGAVLWILRTYPAARFLAVGRLNLDPRFDEFTERVERIPIKPWEDLPNLLARVDVNLAPLEAGNPFSESKSCIKYLEAALVEVPTVASPRPDFVRAIEHGRNGLLADSEEEWRDALRLLVDSEELRRNIGRKARDDVLERHTSRAAGRSARTTLRGLAGGAVDAALTVNWICAEVEPPASTVRLARGLAELGHLVRFYGRARPQHGEGLEVHGHDEKRRLADVAIATDAEAAYEVAAGEEASFRCRLVLDADGAGSSDRERGSYGLPLLNLCLSSESRRRVEELSGRRAESLGLNDVESVDDADWASAAARLATVLDEACFVRLEGMAASSSPI